MKKTITFGKWEMAAIVINAMSIKIFLNLPRSMIEIGGTAGWMIMLYVSLLCLAVFFVIMRLYRKFAEMDPVDIADYVTGAAGRVITGTVLAGALILFLIVVLREFSEDMKIITLTASPLSFVMMFFAIGMAAGAYFGIEAVARCHLIVVPIIIIAYFLIIFGVLPQSDFKEIFPLFGSGIDKVFLQGAMKISVFAELLVLFLMAPYAKNNKTLKSAGIISILATSLFSLISIVVYISIYPYDTALENFLPLYQMARLIDFGRFVQRVEAVFFIVWSSSAYLFLTAVFSILIHVFAKTFGIMHHKPLILPFAAIIFTLAFVPASLKEVIRLDTDFVHYHFYLITFVFTVLLLSAANIKARGRRKVTSDD